jgi:hypothetical protein
VAQPPFFASHFLDCCSPGDKPIIDAAGLAVYALRGKMKTSSTRLRNPFINFIVLLTTFGLAARAMAADPEAHDE